jgi:hypothetical protein
VELVPIALSENGLRYRVTYAGETLVEGRRNPIFDACRALLARGITGRLEVWRQGKRSADMQLDIERGALFAIWETTTLSLRLVPWHPWWRTDDVDPNAVLYGGVQPPAAVCAPPSGGHSPTKTAASDSTAQRDEHYCREARLALTEGRMNAPGARRF